MKMTPRTDEIDEAISKFFDGLDFGDVCRTAIDRPIDRHVNRLFSGGDTNDAYPVTTIAWDIFEPVNGV